MTPSKTEIARAMDAQRPTMERTMNAVPAYAPADDLPSVAPLTPMAMIDKALSNGSGVDVIERLMGLQERWEANQGRKAFDRAIADAKAELPAIIKNQTANRGNAGSYKYEDLAQIAAQIDPVLSRYGLSYRFRTDTDGARIKVACIVSHRDGYSESTSLDSAADTSGAKNPIQAMGSAVTYLQRYTLKAALGLAASKDDDTRAVAAPKVEPMTADDYRALNARIVAQGDAADKVEEFILRKFGAETLADLTKPQMGEALAMIAKREAQQAEKGAA